MAFDNRPVMSVAAAVRAVLLRAPIAAALATAGYFAPASAVAQDAGTAESAPELSEVLVTAQRRSQNLQEIPYNISVVGSDEVANSGAVNLSDLTHVVTGLTGLDQGPSARNGINSLTLRGLSTDPPTTGSVPYLTANTVSTYYGETPIFFPMVLQDVDRVEVLRGPQGTLYGSGAEGGTIRFIPHRPEFNAFNGSISVTGSHTDRSGEINDDVHGVINLPIAQNLAARLGAGYVHFAGFIDAVNLWQKDANGVPVPSVAGNLASGPTISGVRTDINSSNQAYARAALRWKPIDPVDVELNYLHQRTTQAAGQDVSPNWRGGCQDLTATDQGAPVSCSGAPASTFYTKPGGAYTLASYQLNPYEDTVDLGSVAATVDFGLATLTAATSYYKDNSATTIDSIGDYQDVQGGDGGNFVNYPPYNNYPRLAPSQPVLNRVSSFVQELRLVSNSKTRFDYVIGAYFQRQTQDSSFYQNIPGIQSYLSDIGEPNPSELGDASNILRRNAMFRDEALFAELTYHVTDAWQVTAGGRLFRQRFSNDFFGDYPLTGTPAFSGDVQRDFNSHLKKFNTSYDLSSNTKVYFTYSEGFRHGGTNAVPIGGPFASLPQYTVFNPDFAKNYEVGVKGAVLDHRVRYSAAIYRIDLKNFQFSSQTLSDNFGTFNGNDARSKGAELELQAAVSADLTASLGYSYTDSYTTQPIALDDYPAYALVPELGGTGQAVPLFRIPAGARLPGVPKSTANLALDYHVPSSVFASARWSLLLHADGVYRSAAAGNIDTTSAFYWTIPSSIITNARAVFGFRDTTHLSLFVNNISGATAYTGADGQQAISAPYARRIVSRPRTIGLTLEQQF